MKLFWAAVIAQWIRLRLPSCGQKNLNANLSKRILTRYFRVSMADLVNCWDSAALFMLN